MKLTDKKIIEFLCQSPLKSFEAIRDALRYLDGRWIEEDLEYELFNNVLGDNPDEKISVLVPNMGGITADALFALTGHAKAFNLVRRKSREFGDTGGQSEELTVFYELTPAGKEVLKLLKAIAQTKKKIS